MEQYLCGVAGGLGKVVTGHPFDTIKGRVQSGAFRNANEALTSTVKNEGPRALYQGMLPPCISVGCVSGILFFVNAKIRTMLQPDSTKQLTYTQMGIAGGGAGAVTSLILTPLDQVKLWMQVEKRAAAQAASGAGASTAAAAVTAPSAGHYMMRAAEQIGAPQLYRGFVATTLREIGTFGIFFPTNEYLKVCLAYATGRSPTREPSAASSSLPLHLRVVAAGTAGVLCWLPCYPIDVIKSRQQLQGHPLLSHGPVPALAGGSMLSFATRIAREEGAHGFVRGIAPCLLRAFPTYTAQFIIFDALTGRLKERRRHAA
jgi:solute carrier family 25 carnitine/acylcarnitine transporter 20/29